MVTLLATSDFSSVLKASSKSSGVTPGGRKAISPLLFSLLYRRQGLAALLSEGCNAEFKVASISQGYLKWSSPPEFFFLCSPYLHSWVPVNPGDPHSPWRPLSLHNTLRYLGHHFPVKLIRFQSPHLGRCQWYEMEIISRWVSDILRCRLE